MDPRLEHENYRKQLWIDAFCATANANDCKSTKTAVNYADSALTAFDTRFKAPLVVNTTEPKS